MSNIIFTLEARENFLLETTKQRYNLTNAQVYEMIQNGFAELVAEMSRKKIVYAQLRNAITPNINKKEIALVFDTNLITSAWYSLEIFDKILPAFDHKTSHSLLSGDYIGYNEHYHALKQNFFSEIQTRKEITYHHNSKFFIVYINNLAPTLFANLAISLESYAPFVGYFDVTYQSFIKSYLSTILCKTAILHKSEVIMAGEEDNWDEDGVNTTGLPFEKYNFKIRNIYGIFFDLFLSYKIERAVYDGFEKDSEFALNAVSPLISSIDDFEIKIDQTKLEYLLKKKAPRLVKAGVSNYNRSEMAEIIREKIKENYIYEISELTQFEIIKFNVVLEFRIHESEDVIKCSLTLSCDPKSKILNVVTFF